MGCVQELSRGAVGDVDVEVTGEVQGPGGCPWEPSLVLTGVKWICVDIKEFLKADCNTTNIAPGTLGRGAIESTGSYLSFGCGLVVSLLGVTK